MVDFLRAQNTDILMLQEVFNAKDPALEPRFRTYTELPKLLGYKYTDFAPALTFVQPEGAIVEGNAVLSKFPLKSHMPIFPTTCL